MSEKPDVTVTGDMYKESDRSSNISDVKLGLPGSEGSYELVSWISPKILQCNAMFVAVVARALLVSTCRGHYDLCCIDLGSMFHFIN